MPVSSCRPLPASPKEKGTKREGEKKEKKGNENLLPVKRQIGGRYRKQAIQGPAGKVAHRCVAIRVLMGVIMKAVVRFAIGCFPQTPDFEKKKKAKKKKETKKKEKVAGCLLEVGTGS
jgi:hypothetical protein